jgi:ABC-2 type transport system ATP-binding protein
MIELMNIPGIRKMRVREYSRGMRQRLGLVQALINDPELVFLDEPMSGLDPLGRMQARELILRLKEKGKTVFFSSHILSDVEVICDRVGLLVNGELVSIGRIDQLLTSQIQSIDITAENISPAAEGQLRAIATRFTAQAPVFHLSVPDEKTGQEALRIITTTGGTLRAYVPQKESLEEYFLRHSGGVTQG